MEARVVTGGPDLAEVRELFGEYAEWVGVDLSFQGFGEELANLPGDYVAPAGILLLGVVGGAAAGCIAVHKWRGADCEMKRLFVRSAFRGSGCGVFLAERAIEWARAAGYERMVLDTLPSMASAQRLYERLGFRDIPAYRFNPIAGTRYMARPLAGPGDGRA